MPLLIIFSPILTVPILILVLFMSFGAGAQEIANGIPVWAICASVFGLTAVVVASIRAKQPRWLWSTLGMSALIIIQIGLGSFTHIDVAVAASTDPVANMIRGLDQIKNAFPWVLVGALSAAGVAACIWLYEDVKSRRERGYR